MGKGEKRRKSRGRRGEGGVRGVYGEEVHVRRKRGGLREKRREKEGCLGCEGGESREVWGEGEKRVCGVCGVYGEKR